MLDCGALCLVVALIPSAIAPPGNLTLSTLVFAHILVVRFAKDTSNVTQLSQVLHTGYSAHTSPIVVLDTAAGGIARNHE